MSTESSGGLARHLDGFYVLCKVSISVRAATLSDFMVKVTDSRMFHFKIYANVYKGKYLQRAQLDAVDIWTDDI